jgi:hypothetical protein
MTIEIGVCSETIDAVVDEFLKDNGLNTAFIPDFIEKKLYKNVIVLALSAANRVLDTAHVEFLGHRIEFVMKPVFNTPAPETSSGQT